MRAFAVVLAGAVLVAACAPAPRIARPNEPIRTEQGLVRAVVLVEQLEFPWSLAFLPDGRMLVTERPGRLRVVSAAGVLDPEPLGGVPAVDASSMGGLLDVAVHPQFDVTRLVYLAYTAADAAGRGTEVMRARLVGNALEGAQVIFRLAPKSSRATHYGSRLAFDADGALYITLGDRSEPERAQVLDDHAGKIVRILDDGRAPADNPFAGQGTAARDVFTLGHRNVQGAAVHPVTKRLWVSEHGENADDRFMPIVAGTNYGWPALSGPGTPFSGTRHTWTPTIAPSGIAFYYGDKLPAWRGDAFVASLKDRMLVRLRMQGERVVGEEHLLKDVFGRIRDVRAGPDGYLYLLTDERNGKLVQLGRDAR